MGFAAKLLAADLPIADPLPDSPREFIGRGTLIARELNRFRVSGTSVFHEFPCIQAPSISQGWQSQVFFACWGC